MHRPREANQGPDDLGTWCFTDPWVLTTKTRVLDSELHMKLLLRHQSVQSQRAWKPFAEASNPPAISNKLSSGDNCNNFYKCHRQRKQFICWNHLTLFIFLRYDCTYLSKKGEQCLRYPSPIAEFHLSLSSKITSNENVFLMYLSRYCWFSWGEEEEGRKREWICV